MPPAALILSGLRPGAINKDGQTNRRPQKAAGRSGTGRAGAGPGRSPGGNNCYGCYGCLGCFFRATVPRPSSGLPRGAVMEFVEEEVMLDENVVAMCFVNNIRPLLDE